MECIGDTTVNDGRNPAKLATSSNVIVQQPIVHKNQVTQGYHIIFLKVL